MKYMLYFFSLTILLISCEATNTAKCHKIITVINNSNKAIYLIRSSEYPNFEGYKNNPDPLYNTYTTKVNANTSSKNVLPTFGDCYEAIYPSRIESGIMMVYVFDGPILETEGWDFIKANNLVLKRYDLTLQDLNDMNWTITYEGN